MELTNLEEGKQFRVIGILRGKKYKSKPLPTRDAAWNHGIKLTFSSPGVRKKEPLHSWQVKEI